MTLENWNLKASYVGDDSPATAFPFNFKVPASEYLLVMRTINGVTTPAVNYTIDGIGRPGGGTVNLPGGLQTGEVLNLRRHLDLHQHVALSNIIAATIQDVWIDGAYTPVTAGKKTAAANSI